MNELWSHVATGLASVTAAVGGMGIFQRIIIGMQNKKVDAMCLEVKEALALKQDTKYCGILGEHISGELGDIKKALQTLTEQTGKLATNVAVLDARIKKGNGNGNNSKKSV